MLPSEHLFIIFLHGPLCSILKVNYKVCLSRRKSNDFATNPSRGKANLTKEARIKKENITMESRIKKENISEESRIKKENITIEGR